MDKLILAINTSTAPFGLALVRPDAAIVAEILLKPATRGFGSFMPALHHMLSCANVTLRELQALAVAIGPGSFTGLRVGLAAAKGICQGLEIPAVAVSSLEALAAQCPVSPYPICSLIDSRRGEYFAAFYRSLPGQELKVIKGETCLNINELGALVEERTLFFGNSFALQGALLREALGEKALLAPAALWNLRASCVALLGLLKAEKSGFDNLESLVPSYLRPPDIRDKGTASSER